MLSNIVPNRQSVTSSCLRCASQASRHILQLPVESWQASPRQDRAHQVLLHVLSPPPCPTGLPSHPGVTVPLMPLATTSCRCRVLASLSSPRGVPTDLQSCPPAASVPRWASVTPWWCPPCPGRPLLHIRSAKWVNANFPHRAGRPPHAGISPRPTQPPSSLPYPDPLQPPVRGGAGLQGSLAGLRGGGGGGGCSLDACVG